MSNSSHRLPLYETISPGIMKKSVPIFRAASASLGYRVFDVPSPAFPGASHINLSCEPGVLSVVVVTSVSRCTVASRSKSGSGADEKRSRCVRGTAPVLLVNAVVPYVTVSCVCVIRVLAITTSMVRQHVVVPAAIAASMARL